MGLLKDEYRRFPMVDFMCSLVAKIHKPTSKKSLPDRIPPIGFGWERVASVEAGRPAACFNSINY
jgi:hypothetical protein